MWNKKKLENLSVEKLQKIKEKEFRKSKKVIDLSKIEMVTRYFGEHTKLITSRRLFEKTSLGILYIRYFYNDAEIFLFPLEYADKIDYNSDLFHLFDYNYIVYNTKDFIYIPGDWLVVFNTLYRRALDVHQEEERNRHKEKKDSLIKDLEKMGITQER